LLNLTHTTEARSRCRSPKVDCRRATPRRMLRPNNLKACSRDRDPYRVPTFGRCRQLPGQAAGTEMAPSTTCRAVSR
jgi:hypothetical protein